MTLPADLPVVDHHCHLSPGGEGVAAARRFERAGGTHLFVTTHNWNHRPLRTVEDYRVQFEEMEALTRRVRAETHLGTSLVIAPYPVDLLRLSEDLGLGPAGEVHVQALDLAGRWVAEHRAVALGEVGRPHFPVPPEVARLVESILEHAFEVARDQSCPVVVHSEDLSSEGYAELADLARRVGLPTERVVKHYARSRQSQERRAGVTPSFLARRELVRDVLPDPAPWFLETDFLDDLGRPGAVLDIATVPKRAAWIAREQPDLVERLRIPFVESVTRVYGFQPEGPAGRPT